MPRVAADGPQRRPMVRAAGSTRRAAAQKAKSGTLRTVSQTVPAKRISPKVYSYSNPGPVGRFGRLAGRALGSYLGGPMGGALGDSLGGMAHYIGKVFGSGDYVTNADRVKQNVLVNDAQIPQFGSGPNTVHIRHREFLGDIISSSTPGAFNVQQFPLNPGQNSTFPWLSNVVGTNFQQYRINGMLFEFRTMSADALNSTNTALGSVVMATDYDSADSAFTNKAQMENTEFGISCKPSCSAVHAIECARSQTAVSELYVRPAAVPANADIRLYDLGQFYIATVGMQAASVNIGELWVTYDITFFKAIQLTPGLSIRSAHYKLALGSVATLPLTPVLPASFDNIPLSFPAGGLSFSFPANIPIGSVWVLMANYQTNAAGEAAATSQSSFTLTNGLTRLNIWTGSGGSFNPNPTPAAAAVRTQGTNIIVRYDGGNAPGTLPTCALAAWVVPLVTYLQADLFVSQMNGNMA
ncbi:MAG: coat protein [Torentivirus crutis]|uniref:Coat protein n=1 Tax=Cressdnaviricota sp. TaxID=2748378 RepID=A0A3G2YT96_9VIRU|nr:MAG: coat protein [Cressdnaviricota sp.]